jgi:peptidyl-prolyl cis-trans isomerase D
MISSFRKFSKSKIAGVFVGIIILPFVFWGMGNVFSGGNTNVLAKIENEKISTQEFVNYVNNSNIPEQTIRNNLDKNIIEELLSNLISTTILDLEIKDFEIKISKKTLLRKIKKNKNFLDDANIFQRIKYEKFLLENNQSAPEFELRLKIRELQKHLFDYVGAGTVSPKFMINSLYEKENTKLEIEFINLENFYRKSNTINDQDMKNFIEENKDQLKVEYIDFNYIIINPLNLTGVDEFSQTFFDKIDQIEIDLSSGIQFETIVSNLNIIPVKITDFKFTSDKNEIEKKIFQLRNNKFDIFENGNDYIIYEVKNFKQKDPDLNDNETKKEIIELISQKNKYDYNRELLEKINNKKFNQSDFDIMGKNLFETTKLNSIKDNNKFEINAVEILYSLPVNSFTLINDEEKNIYLAKVKKIQKEFIKKDDSILKEYINKHNTNSKNTLLKSYDLLLNKKYNVDLNKKTIERVKNFFR